MSQKIPNCPVLNPNSKLYKFEFLPPARSKINWMKDHILLVKNPKHELNKKGMLRIRDATFSDSGVYSCIGKIPDLKMMYLSFFI